MGLGFFQIDVSTRILFKIFYKNEEKIKLVVSRVRRWRFLVYFPLKFQLQLTQVSNPSFNPNYFFNGISPLFPRKLNGQSSFLHYCLLKTADVVEVMVGSSSSSNSSSGKLFTWGDGDKGRLGHGDKEARLVPTSAGTLVEPNFFQVVCGHSLIAAFTREKGANGRLGHGDTEDRNSPSLVVGLKDKQVKSIVCGTNFTAAICLHKWIAGVDQSMC